MTHKNTKFTQISPPRIQEAEQKHSKTKIKSNGPGLTRSILQHKPPDRINSMNPKKIKMCVESPETRKAKCSYLLQVGRAGEGRSKKPPANPRKTHAMRWYRAQRICAAMGNAGESLVARDFVGGGARTRAGNNRNGEMYLHDWPLCSAEKTGRKWNSSALSLSTDSAFFRYEMRTVCYTGEEVSAPLSSCHKNTLSLPCLKRVIHKDTLSSCPSFLVFHQLHLIWFGM